ncbi:hypothetical protein HCN44_010047 [Aphidius gifuensis]|uniref:LRRCT domain-containing protein n=1 Tax=Aphidius gifuensis TaxID=684658 RepID=A0A835CRL8_APHGI|nr:phospholipase A2 inhibitor-like [Aphidius gifuensis]KAF7993452.1 hypothetical protein HCN44_010047 [Aphidius gifuensis]
MWTYYFLLSLCIITQVQSKQIDLSYRGLKKEDFFARLQSTINIREVTDLNLKGNRFDNFIDCSTHLDHMKTLDLAENHLGQFLFLCNDGYALESLNVSHNFLEYIDDSSLNNKVSKLKILDLSFNKLSTINETMLQHMKILEFLSVASNPIVNLHENAFKNQKSMIHLDLTNVSQVFFPSTLFKAMTNLSYLNISHNKIEILPYLPLSLEELDISSTNILYVDNLIFPRMMKFYMNHMPNITEVVLNDFENLTMLEILSMENNPILSEFRVWPPNSRILPRLQHLSVRGCALETLTDDLRPIMQRVSIVDLQNNPWHCDCRMQWVNRLNLSNELSREIKCKTPDQHTKKILAEIPNHELVCVEISTIGYTAILVSTTIILLVILVGGFWIFWKGPLRQWSLPKRGTETVSYKNVVESSNDLISHLIVADDHNDE